MYEKKRITENGDVEIQVECGFCTRAKCGIICRECSAVFPNIRARKSCPDHPREMFLMDLLKCPSCKSSNIDDMSGVDSVDRTRPSRPMLTPARKRVASSAMRQEPSTMLSPPATPVSVQGVAKNSMMTQLRSVDRPAPASTTSVFQTTDVGPIAPSAGFSKGIGTPVPARVSIADEDDHPMMSLINVALTRPSVGVSNQIVTSGQNLISLAPKSAVGHVVEAGCICERKINYVMCEACGYFHSGGLRKVKACPLHPLAHQLLVRCPSCSLPNTLEEDLLDDN